MGPILSRINHDKAYYCSAHSYGSFCQSSQVSVLNYCALIMCQDSVTCLLILLGLASHSFECVPNLDCLLQVSIFES